MEDVGGPSASRQAGKTARGRSDCHFRHPACVENRMPLARRSASLWATDDHLQPLHRWSQRRIWQRIFEKMAAAGPVPDELSIDSSHVKAHRSAAGSTVRAAEE